MISIQGSHLIAVSIMLGACLALAAQNILIRKGTDTGRAYDAVLVVMITNIVVLVPIVAIYYYPDYGLRTRSILSFIAAGLLGTMLGRMFKYVSIGRIGASRTEPIINANALVATVLGVVLLGERITAIHLLAILAIVVGIVLISLETTRENPHDLSRRKLAFGMVLPFGGAVAYGLEPIFATHGLQTGTPAPIGVVIKTVAATFGFLVYLRYVDAIPKIAATRSNDVKTFVLAGLSNTAFILGYYVALGLAPVSVVVPIIPTSTLFTVVLAALFMPQRLERVTARLVGAALIVATGVIVLTSTT